jgi:hypothetical protein
LLDGAGGKGGGRSDEGSSDDGLHGDLLSLVGMVYSIGSECKIICGGCGTTIFLPCCSTSRARARNFRVLVRACVSAGKL